jgi:hypothetical protein
VLSGHKVSAMLSVNEVSAGGVVVSQDPATVLTRVQISASALLLSKLLSARLACRSNSREANAYRDLSKQVAARAGAKRRAGPSCPVQISASALPLFPLSGFLANARLAAGTTQSEKLGKTARHERSECRVNCASGADTCFQTLTIPHMPTQLPRGPRSVCEQFLSRQTLRTRFE